MTNSHYKQNTRQNLEQPNGITTEMDSIESSKRIWYNKKKLPTVNLEQEAERYKKEQCYHQIQFDVIKSTTA